MQKVAFSKLKTGLYIFISVILIGTVILLFYFLKNTEKQIEISGFGEKLGILYSESGTLRGALKDFTGNEHGDDFYTHKKDTYTDNVYFYLTKCKKITDELLAESPDFTFEVTSLLNENISLINDFEDYFKILVENTIKTGNDNYGYIEHIIKTEEKINKVLDEYPSIFERFERLKSLKTDLLYTGDAKSEEEFIKNKNDFIKIIRQNKNIFGDVAEKQIVIDNSADWINTVLSVYKLQKHNGNKFYPGLKNDLIEITEVVQKNVNDANTVINSYGKEKFEDFKLLFIILLSCFALLLTFIVVSEYRFFKKELLNLKKNIEKLNVFDKVKAANDIDIEDIFVMTEKLRKDYKIKTDFVTEIKLGKDDEISPDFKEKDKLGNALVGLRQQLKEREKKAMQKDKERAVSDKYRDATLRFGKIIRQNFGDIEALTFNLLTELVRFLGAEIGGIYIIDGNTDVLKLKTSYAYNEKKIIKKDIKIGEGLVGTCAADKSSIYIDRIDDDYIKIVSGFGYTKPKTLLLTPVFAENKIYGVIELASSGIFTEDDVKFTETISEDLAYTLSYLLKKTN